MTCPHDVDSWDKASTAAKCIIPNVYHCLKTSNEQLIETCLEKTWIQPGNLVTVVITKIVYHEVVASYFLNEMKTLGFGTR